MGADFVHFLMWSGTRLPCAGSKVSQVVKCSFNVESADCSTDAAGCQWTEGACYPKFYASIITKPKPLAAFKRQVCLAGSVQPRACPGHSKLSAHLNARLLCWQL